MNYDEIEHFRTNHPAWSLLRSANVGLVLASSVGCSSTPMWRTCPRRQLASELDDELYALNQRLGDDRFPKTAVEYLDDWASPERGWLRKFYPAGIRRSSLRPLAGGREGAAVGFATSAAVSSSARSHG